jgi:hypothetical protein
MLPFDQSALCTKQATQMRMPGGAATLAVLSRRLNATDFDAPRSIRTSDLCLRGKGIFK